MLTNYICFITQHGTKEMWVTVSRCHLFVPKLANYIPEVYCHIVKVILFMSPVPVPLKNPGQVQGPGHFYTWASYNTITCLSFLHEVSFFFTIAYPSFVSADSLHRPKWYPSLDINAVVLCVSPVTLWTGVPRWRKHSFRTLESVEVSNI